MPAQKTAILAAIRSGRPKRDIAFQYGVEVETVERVGQADRAVADLKRRGNVDPKVLYANFADLLTQQECGVR